VFVASCSFGCTGQVVEMGRVEEQLGGLRWLHTCWHCCILEELAFVESAGIDPFVGQRNMEPERPELEPYELELGLERLARLELFVCSMLQLAAAAVCQERVSDLWSWT